MRRAALLVLAALLPGAAPPPPSADWQLIHIDGDRSRAIAVDAAALRDVPDGRFVHAAMIYRDDYEAYHSVDDPRRTADEIDLVVDCAGRRARGLVRIRHAPDGTAKALEEPRLPWTKASSPEDNKLADFVCATGVRPRSLASLGSAFPVETARRLMRGDSPAAPK